MLTRRDILKAFLGLPIAMAACRNGSNEIEFDGEIVGASNDVGHILRERRDWEVPDGEATKSKVAIVGGGIAGLGAARRLTKEGFDDFVLFELENRIGGTSGSGSVDLNGSSFSKEKQGGSFQYPWGAHYLPVPFKENTDLVELLEESDVVESKDINGELVIKEEFLTRDPEERLFHQGRWYEGIYLHAGETDEDVKQLKRFEALIKYWTDWRDKDGKRAFSVPVATCSTDSEVLNLDSISFARWLELNELDSERLIWYCDYSCRDDYGLSLKQTSAWAGLFYFCARVPKGGQESQPYVTFPEGNGRFVKQLAKASKRQIRRGTIVVEIVPGEKETALTCYDPRTKKFSMHISNEVIFAAPLFTAPFIIRGFRETPHFDGRFFVHNSWFVANLFLKERPQNRFRKDFPLSWDNVFYHSKSLGYVTSTHQKGIDYGPTILTYYYPMATNSPLEGMKRMLSLSWSELADICLSDIAQAHPNIRKITQRVDIMRWGHAMIGPGVGLVSNPERQKPLKHYRGIHFANSDMSGIAIFEEAFYHGNRAAREVVSRLR